MAGNATAAAVNSGHNTNLQLPSYDLIIQPRTDAPEDVGVGIIGESPLQVTCSSPLKLDDLQPDVLYHVLLFLRQRDVAHMKMCSTRLRINTLQACQHWAPKVECWLSSDPNSTALLRRLRDLDASSQQQADRQPHQHQPSSMPVSSDHVQQLAAQQHADPAAPSLPHHAGSAADLTPDLHLAVQQQLIGLRQQVHSISSSLPPQAAHPPNAQAMSQPKMLDWRQVWCCIERAQQGPWQLDVQALAPSVSPNGVLLTFELLLQQPAPPAEASSCEQHTVGWRDSVTVMSFVLDRKTVEIVVDASGRVTSPQRDWCQGCIQLLPGQPRLLALEVSYIFPVPAWFLHPCTLAAPRIASSSAGSSSCGGSCASSVSGMVVDQTWDSYSSAATSSSMSISQSSALCSALGRADSGSLASSSLSSSGSLGNCVSMGSCNSSSTGGISNGSGCTPGGRPRLSLDLSVGFGSYVIDPRYMDDAPTSLIHRGLERIELSSRVCWRPSKVQSWLGRLLPGIRGHSSSSNSNSSSNSSSSTSTSAGGAVSNASGGPGGPSNAAAACAGGGSGLKQGVKPSFSVGLSKAAAWQVPSDTDRRFAEGFMFWAVQHKLEQLLLQQSVLPPCCQAGAQLEVATGADFLPVASQQCC